MMEMSMKRFIGCSFFVAIKSNRTRIDLVEMGRFISMVRCWDWFRLIRVGMFFKFLLGRQMMHSLSVDVSDHRTIDYSHWILWSNQRLSNGCRAQVCPRGEDQSLFIVATMKKSDTITVPQSSNYLHVRSTSSSTVTPVGVSLPISVSTIVLGLTPPIVSDGSEAIYSTKDCLASCKIFLPCLGLILC